MFTQDYTKWKAIPGFEGYEVSDQGQVRSYRKYGGGLSLTSHLLKPSTSRPRGGYKAVGLRRNGQTYQKRVARLVLLAFVGPCPNGMEMCHNNSNSDDDRLENLRYDTHLGNTRDRLSLSDAQVIEMRERRAQGESIATLAQSFNIKYRTVYDLCRGTTYRWIGGPITPSGRWGKLSINDVVAIRTERANTDITLKELGKKYSRSESAVSRICSGEQYSKDEGPITTGKIVRERSKEDVIT